MPDPAPVASNPFSLVAYVLFKVRYSLEEYDGSRPPRWVRIARGREFQGEAIGTMVSAAVLGLSESTALMADLAIRIEELLIQTDAAKAIAEATLDFIDAASSPELAAAVGVLVGPSFSSEVTGALAQINATAQNIEALLDYIPEPEDVRQLGHELYQLLCIVQRTGAPEPTDTDHVDLEATGKVRLCAWAYGRRVRARALGESSTTVDVLQLGMRRLLMGDNPTRSEGVWEGPEEPITIFERDFGGPTYGDLTELVALLAAHGYADPGVPPSPTSITNALRRLLLQFQFLNELPLTGEVDDHTLNRLMNYDFARKNLRRARTYDPNADWPWATTTPTPPVPVVWGSELPLVNPGADHYADEGITPVGMPYSYYEVRTADAIRMMANPPDRGWVADSNALMSFVALRSRSRTPDAQVATQGRYDGGVWSEGEAADGLYFWAARHVEPWRAGRTGAPQAGALFGSFGAAAPAAAQQSRMYQWIPVPASMSTSPVSTVPPGTTPRLYVVASVLQRSLYRDRGAAGLPDQGRIRLEVYTSGYVDALSDRVPGNAVASAQTPWFPDHGTTAVALQLDEVDRRRVWFLRKTEPLELTGIVGVDVQNITALCLVAEGLHQSGWDTDAYFDDFRVEYYWRIVPSP